MADNTPSTAAAAAPVGDDSSATASVVQDLDMTGLPVINESMTSLHSILNQEYQRLKDQWAQLLAERDALDKIKNRIQSVSVTELDRLRLNVGGQRFEVRATCVQKNTYFRTLLSGTFTPADQDGFYFIDRDPQFVHVIMQMLRDGDVELSPFNDTALERIRADAEFYMVQDLVAKIDRARSARRAGSGIARVPINREPNLPLSSFNGIFFEVNVLKRDMVLHSIAFVAGESRKIVGEAYLKEGGIDSAAQPQKIGDVAQQVDQGGLVTISFSAMPLPKGVVTIGVYSSSCPTAVAVVPEAAGSKDFSADGLMLGHTYHTTNPRGHWTKQAGRDEFSFVGELTVSSL